VAEERRRGGVPWRRLCSGELWRCRRLLQLRTGHGVVRHEEKVKEEHNRVLLTERQGAVTMWRFLMTNGDLQWMAVADSKS
jgi:hypothetical protein